MKNLTLVAIFFFAVHASWAQAQAPSSEFNSVLQAYRTYFDIDPVSSPVPVVVEVPIRDGIQRPGVSVVNTTMGIVEPHYGRTETRVFKQPVSVSAGAQYPSAQNMQDGNSRTYTEFAYDGFGTHSATIEMRSANPITSSSFKFALDENVTLPTTVELRAVVAGEERIVVAKRSLSSAFVQFPETTSDSWRIIFGYTQPLRIVEIDLLQKEVPTTSIRAVRFLAQPGHSYRVYYDPDRDVRSTSIEAGDLARAQDVVRLQSLVSKTNPSYTPYDQDGDTISDVSDNCPGQQNFDQSDINSNGVGDVCDDYDLDYVLNVRDNCPDLPNRDQRDTDADGIGDICDGEESRLTEKYTWIPWVGMGFAALVLVILLGLTIMHPPKHEEFVAATQVHPAPTPPSAPTTPPESPTPPASPAA